MQSGFTLIFEPHDEIKDLLICNDDNVCSKNIGFFEFLATVLSNDIIAPKLLEV